MTILADVRLGRFGMLVQRETVKAGVKVMREGVGEIIVDLPGLSITFTDHGRYAGEARG